MPTHALIFIGCEYDAATATFKRWKVENSWGDKTKSKGFITMTDDWFDKFVTVAAVPASCLPPHARPLYKKAERERRAGRGVKVLPCYDILGTFARADTELR